MTPDSDKTIKPSPGIAGVQAYHVPAHGAPIDLKLDANEGEPPSEEVLRRILEIGPDVLRRYPDAAPLQALLAEAYGVPASRLIVTAGADDALDRLCRAVLAPGRRIVLTEPSFEMIPRYARIMGAEVDELPWWSGEFPVEEMIAAIRPETAIVAVVSPNNPTGTAAHRDVLDRLSAAAPNAVLLLDHAYVEFADEDHTPHALGLPNTVIVRTMSKAWGLAGLRVGYAIGPEEIISWMRASGGPYAVSRPSLALAAARIEIDDGETALFVEQVRRERDALHALFDELGVQHTESHANFAFVTTPKALWIRDALAGLGIAIRAYPGHPTLGESLRITCPGNEDDGNRLLAAIRSALAPTGIVLSEAHLSEGEILEVQRIAEEREIAVTTVMSGEFPNHGWLIGRTVNDIRLAREHRLVPISLLTDETADTGISTALVSAGAARVCRSPEDLEAILP